MDEDDLDLMSKTAVAMAREVNGAEWDDLTEMQKRGWLLKVAWAADVMLGIHGFFSLAKKHLEERDGQSQGS